MSSLSDQLLSASITPFDVTKSDGTIIPCFQRDLSAGDVLNFVGIEEGPDRNKALLQLVSLAIVNEDGTPAFGPDDVDRLSEMPVKIFEQLSNQVVKAAGLEAVKDEEGNS